MPFVGVLRDIEKNFANLIDPSFLLSAEKVESNLSESKILSPILDKAIRCIDYEHIDRAMSKLREFIRIYRSIRISAFSSISTFQKLIEKKTDKTLEAAIADVSAFFYQM